MKIQVLPLRPQINEAMRVRYLDTIFFYKILIYSNPSNTLIIYVTKSCYANMPVKRQKYPNCKKYRQ